MKKAETLRGRGTFRSLSTGGTRLEGALLRCTFRTSTDRTPLLLAGVGVQDRTVTAVCRNRVRRLLRAAIDRERERLLESLRSRRCSLEVLFTLRRGSIPPVPTLGAIHEDLGRLCTTLLARLPRPPRQQ